jgi:hypothetical protein
MGSIPYHLKDMQQPFSAERAPMSMRAPGGSQAKPMTIWCLYVIALVAIFMAASVALFYMPGQGPPLQKQGVPAIHSSHWFSGAGLMKAGGVKKASASQSVSPLFGRSQVAAGVEEHDKANNAYNEKKPQHLAHRLRTMKFKQKCSLKNNS